MTWTLCQTRRSVIPAVLIIPQKRAAFDNGVRARGARSARDLSATQDLHEP